MAEEGWVSARLIPTSGIRDQNEAERRATSALLAVLGSVKEFGRAITKPLGAPAAELETFIEVPFKLGDRTVYPDGVIQARRAGKTWTALVEVKTGSAELTTEQVENYIGVARENEFNVVLTISNQIAPAPGGHPVDVDKRKLHKVQLVHLSWAEILTVAERERIHRGVNDPDQAWILGELIRYLHHPKSGALDFRDMGARWVKIREAVIARTLRAGDRGLPEVVSRWEQLLRFTALTLGRELGTEVQVVLTRKEAVDSALRFTTQAQSLVDRGVFDGAIRVPGAVSQLAVEANLRTGRVTVAAEVDAPRSGRATTRVNWLVRQLKAAPDDLRIDALVHGTSRTTSALLNAARNDPTELVEKGNRELRAFRISVDSKLGSNRKAGRSGFIDSVVSSVDEFYRSVVQDLRPWTGKAPQLPRDGRSAAEEAGLDIAPSSRDSKERVPRELSQSPEEHPTDDVIKAVAAVDETNRTSR